MAKILHHLNDKRQKTTTIELGGKEVHEPFAVIPPSAGAGFRPSTVVHMLSGRKGQDLWAMGKQI